MPTIKQRLAISKMVENGGNIGSAMISAGYSQNTAKTPKKLTNSKGWKELMEAFLPEETLITVHKQQLKATKVLLKNGVKYLTPDNDARIKALDLGYKLRGKYKQVENQERIFTDWSLSELQEYAEKGLVPNRFDDHL